MKNNLPEIYAQHCLQNDRIISLLSSVLQRSLRPDFYQAIDDRFPSALETQSVAGIHNRHITAGLVFVTDQRHRDMIQVTQDKIAASRLYSKEMVLTGDSKKDSYTLDDILHSIMLNTKVLIVATPDACSWLFSYLQEKQIARAVPQSLCGVLTLFPTRHEAMATLELPTLCLVSNKDGNVTQGSTRNPYQITAVVKGWESSLRQSREGRLWIARTALKYCNALVTMLSSTPFGNQQPTTRSRL